MNNLIDISTAAELLGKTERRMQQMCQCGEIIGSVKKDGKWLIPAAAHARLCEAAWTAEIANIPAAKRDKTLRRLAVVQEFEKFSAKVADIKGFGRKEAAESYARNNNIKLRTLYRWLADYRCGGLQGLVDKRGGDYSSLAFSPEAAEVFKAMYLTQQRLTLKQCWQNVSYINKDENRSWTIPPLRSMYAWVDRSIPEPVRILLREGVEAYNAKCGPYIQADPDSFQPGECWVGDHHQFNFWIRGGGKWVRPWLTAWMDYRSRKIVGWYISACPNQTTVLVAMKGGIEKYGPPDKVKIDNGKDYDSEMWTGTTKARRIAARAGYIDEQWVSGLYAWMGIDVSFSQKYHPQSKPIERLFATVDEQFSKTIPTYCGKDPQRRPDTLAGLLKTEEAIRQAYSLATIAETFAAYVDVYNNTLHSGVGMDGRSPMQVFETRRSRRVIDKNVLDMLMCVWSGELKVGKNGVRFKGMLYGQFDAQLLGNFGKKVRVAYDPNDIRRIAVYDAATMLLICFAEQNRLIKYGDTVSEEAMRSAQQQKARIRKAFKSYRDARQIAGLDLTDLTIKAMQDAQVAESKDKDAATPTIRPVRTPLDGQAERLGKELAAVQLRKAAGAEGMSDLDIDLGLLQRKSDNVKLDFLSDEQ